MSLTDVALTAALAVLLALLTEAAVTRARDRARASALSELRKRGFRIARLRFARRPEIRRQILQAPVVRDRIREAAEREGRPASDIERRAGRYADEIVPAFSLLSYYRLGAAVARTILNFFYRVVVERSEARRFHESVPADASVVYVMNHRSNVDYVLVGHMLMKFIAISYAVGEWARVWPLEKLFKSFGSYFVRRKFHNDLYHAVLAEYVRLMTREGITQGIFLEGGLSRDGALREPKIGLLDYILQTYADPSVRRPLYFVPCGINYDRVIEDRVLRAEKEGDARALRPLRRFVGTCDYVFKNAYRAARGHFKRYGVAAVGIGDPFDAQAYLRSRPFDWFSLSRPQRLEEVKKLAELLMTQIARAIPVLAVPLAAAAWRREPSEAPVPRKSFLDRIARVREEVRRGGGRELGRRKSDEEVLQEALTVLAPRKMMRGEDGSVFVPPSEEPTLEYYARSLDHFLATPAASRAGVS